MHVHSLTCVRCWNKIPDHLMNLNEDPVLAFSLGSSPRSGGAATGHQAFQGAAHTTSASELAIEREEVICELPQF